MRVILHPHFHIRAEAAGRQNDAFARVKAQRPAAAGSLHADHPACFILQETLYARVVLHLYA